MVFKLYKTVPKIAAGQYLVPKFRITSHVHLAVSYYKCLPQKSPLPLSRKSFYGSIPKGSSPFTSAPLSHYPPTPCVYGAALRPALHCGVHNPPTRGTAAPSHVPLNPPSQLVSMRCASESQPCANQQTRGQDWCWPHSQEADTQFWTMGCTPKTSINLSTCFSKEGSLKWFCAHWKLAPGSETERRKAGSQFKLGRWKSLTSRGGKTSTCVYCLYLQRRNRR